MLPVLLTYGLGSPAILIEEHHGMAIAWTQELKRRIYQSPLRLSIWPDGTIIWSRKDPADRHPFPMWTFYRSQLEPMRVQSLLTRLRRKGVFEVSDFMSRVPDGGDITVTVRDATGSVQWSYWQVPTETAP